MKYKTNTIRNMFLNFFKSKDHHILPSSSLVPSKTSNLLFTNAGMNQFQDIFLGKKKYLFKQVVTVQRCLRTGGKHNDLENVGYSEYHNTFFEMLGNFSFGSYFKKEAILYAWELLTDKKWFNIPKEKLLVTVYYTDDESYNIWKNIIKLPIKDIIKIGNANNKQYESDNFWQMNETGLCGPCTEIFFKKKKLDIYDVNNKTQCIEIWNIVFIQFNKINSNTLIPLKTVSVDTGMGLERITSILQDVKSNYHTDEFKKIIYNIHNIYNIDIIKFKQSINIIADHIRAAVFIIGDNIIPSNEHRGYILRRIIRRALLHGQKLNIQGTFFYKLAIYVIEYMQDFWIYLKEKAKYIKNILKQEELQFIQTLKKGLKLLNLEIKKIKNNILDSQIIFYLYDTIGFPIDLTRNICYEKNIKIDEKKLKNIILINKKKQNKIQKYPSNNIIHIDLNSKFKGYDEIKIVTTVQKIFIDDQESDKISKNQYGIIFLKETPFFPESGGQIGDTGIIYQKTIMFEVSNTKIFKNAIGHLGTLKIGEIHVQDCIIAKIDIKKRLSIQKNHSATHLLNAGLKKELKYNIEQKGSFINTQYLRFDFSYPKSINMNNICNIENTVNKIIQKNISVQIQYYDFQKIKHKYIFLKNKNYDTYVRTLTIGDFSKEICKGTHVNRTGEIGLFKILSCKNIAFGVKRIEATTGICALQYIHEKLNLIEKIKNILKTDDNTILLKIQKIIYNFTLLKQENNFLNQKNIYYYVQKLIKKNIKIYNTNFLIHQIDIQNSKLLKKIIDNIKKKIQSGIIILFYQKNNKHIFIVGVTKNLIKIIQAKKIIEIIKYYTQGLGGGKNELGECIGNNKNISLIIQDIQSYLLSKNIVNNITHQNK